MHMEDLPESVELDRGESNELRFRVNVEGASGPAKVRLVCESDDVSYMFPGLPTDRKDTVRFVIPSKSILAEGTYRSTIEVLIEGRYFAPVTFEVRMKSPVKVVAESLVSRSKTPLKVTAKPLFPTLKERYAQRRGGNR